MAGALLFRRLSLSPAAAAGLFRHNFCYATAVKEETPEVTEKKIKKENGEWLKLPPFTPTVNGSSLGRTISRGRRKQEDSEEEERTEGIETTMSALKWVVHCCPHVHRSGIHKLFRLRQVRRECLEGEGVDGGAEAPGFQLKRVGEKYLMNLGERIFLPKSVKGPRVNTRKYECNEEEMNFTRGLVLYKDSAIIAINKPPKLPVQGGAGIKKSVDELAAAYLRYDNKDAPRLVHRLDQDSSGILVTGRTQTSAAVLHSVFREKTAGVMDDKETDWKKRFLHKRYLALVFGVPEHLNGLISVPLAKVVVDDGKSERITVADSESPSQHAMTEYKVIQTSNHGYTWVELAPLTGRKHQLRVHCAEVLGTPIVGDYKYGWQAHRKWKALSSTKLSQDKKLGDRKINSLGHDLDCGSIAEKQPHLHLHCKQLILPNISVAFENASPDSEFDFSKLENLNLVAPLPSHMQRSWNLLNSLTQ